MSQDEKAWYSFVIGWKALIMYLCGLEIPKPMDQWTIEEFTASDWNFNGAFVLQN